MAQRLPAINHLESAGPLSLVRPSKARPLRTDAVGARGHPENLEGGFWDISNIWVLAGIDWRRYCSSNPVGAGMGDSLGMLPAT